MAGENGIYTVMVDSNGDIHEISGYQKGRKLGVDIRQEAKLYEEKLSLEQTVAELTEVLENWRPIMIETGHLILPKTPEEIAQEVAMEQMRVMHERDAQQAEINRALLAAVQQSQASAQQSNETVQRLENIVRELMERERDGDGDQVSVKPSPKAQPQTRPSGGKKPTANAVGTKKSANNAS